MVLRLLSVALDGELLMSATVVMSLSVRSYDERWYLS